MYAITITCDPSKTSSMSLSEYSAAFLWAKQELDRLDEPDCSEFVAGGSLHNVLNFLQYHVHRGSPFMEEVQELRRHWLELGTSSIEKVAQAATAEQMREDWWCGSRPLRLGGMRMSLDTVSHFSTDGINIKDQERFFFRYLDILTVLQGKGYLGGRWDNIVKTITFRYPKWKWEAEALRERYGIPLEVWKAT